MKRAFVAINLPGEIREKLVKWQEIHKNMDVRWTKKDSLHITLFFIGWIEDEKIKNISLRLKTIADNYQPFDIYLTEITVGPDEKNPRMIWANGPVPDELKKLSGEITETMEKIVDRREIHPFKNHITLARKRGSRPIKSGEPRPIRAGIKLFNEEISLKFRVENFELMESKLLRDGAEYRIIESFGLKYE